MGAGGRANAGFRLPRTASASAAALLAFGFCVAPAAPAAFADGVAVNPVSGNHGFLVVTEGDTALFGNTAEGSIAVGGDLSFGHYSAAAHSAGSFTVEGDPQPSALVVGGVVDFAASSGELQVLNSGYVKIGSLSGAHVSTTDHNNAQVNTVVSASEDRDALPRVSLTTRQPAEAVSAPPIDFGALFTDYRARAASMSRCEGTVVPLHTDTGQPISGDYPAGVKVALTLAPDRQNTWNISAADLAAIEAIHFTTAPTEAGPLLVNVDTSGVGGSFEWTTPNMAGVGRQDAAHILFNFSGASEVVFSSASRTVEGSLFAPDAAVRWLSSSNIEGNVIAASFEHGSPDGSTTGAGGLHLAPFRGELAQCASNGGEEPTPTPPPTETPTPTPAPSPGETPEPTPTPGETGEPWATPLPSGSSSPSPPTSGNGPGPGSGPGSGPGAGTGSGGSLPVTGASLSALVVGAAVVTAVGAAALVVGRRRRH